MNSLLQELGPPLISILIFLALNGLFVAGEVSLLKLRFSHFNPELLERLRGERPLRALLDAPDWAIRVMRLGTVLSILGYALSIIPLIEKGLDGLEAALFGGETALSLVVAFLIAVTLHYLVAEWVARRLGLRFPRECLRLAALPTRLVAIITRPFIAPLEWLGDRFFALMPTSSEAAPSFDLLDIEAQIELMGDVPASRTFSVTQRILKNTLRLRELVVADVLLPRNQVRFFNLRDPIEDNLAIARESGHTRFPLCDGDLDRCVGLIHIKDLFRANLPSNRIDLKRLRRDIIRVDSEETLEEALAKLLAHKMHMALVIDEFRGTEGVLTLEIILEQMVGEIRDEFDADEEVLIQASTPDSTDALVSGLARIHELGDRFGITLEHEEVSTLGGLITTELGRIPEKGEALEIEGLHIEVTEVDDTRVIEARVRRLDQSKDPAP